MVDPDAETQRVCLHNSVRFEVGEPVSVHCLDCGEHVDLHEWVARHREVAERLALCAQNSANEDDASGSQRHE